MTIIGMGPGDRTSLSTKALAIIAKAPMLIGSQRLIELFPDQPGVVAIQREAIQEQLIQHPDAVVLMSGDTGFFSGAKALMEMYPEAEVIPGISSLSYFYAKLRRSYEDVHWISLHGRQANITASLLQHRQVFLLTDRAHNPWALAQRLPSEVQAQTMCYIGEDLSLPEEGISQYLASEIPQRNYSSLCVVLMEYMGSSPSLLLRDDELQRADVPMTKEEVRAIALLKLAPRAGEVMIDVGSGTGSISLALARLGVEVHAIERKPEAFELGRANHQQLGGNVQWYLGQAGEWIHQLPKADAAFIGGSSGELGLILEQLRLNNPEMRLVISAISLETFSEVMTLCEQQLIKLIDMTQVQISRSRKAGRYHLMQANNPIYLMEVCFG